ncbi:MAG: ATP-binding cassette domain-containing protein [Gammaproteobacteria bacterium]
MSETIISARKMIPAGLAGETVTTRALDLDVRGGETVCLIGPTNTGKTNYLRTMAAIEPPLSGEVMLLERDMRQFARQVVLDIRQRVAFIGDSAPLLSTLSGLVNVMLPALYHERGDRDAVMQQAEAVLDRLGWDGDSSQLPAYLSDHERRLLALARCLIMDPAAILIDEPFRMTDLACWKQLADVYRELTSVDGRALVIVTNNLHFVKRNADRIVFFEPDAVKVFDSWDALHREEDRYVEELITATGE